jgi:endonuclease/exonuclease/phosphatase family metal-dependent hydrolase
VRTIPAPLRRRPGGRAPSAVAELAVAALTVVFGLQLLRLMVSTMVGVYRDRLGAPLAGLALFAFVVVGLGLLAVPVARLLGRSRALVVSVAGVALVRLAIQLVPDATARWLLAPVGVMLFCWFVPLWLARDGRGFGLALLAGLAVDTALAGFGGSWDYAWSTSGRTAALAVMLAVAALWALAAVGVGPGPERPGTAAGRAGLAAALPLAGVGPALFLHGLVWQNLGWQTVLGGRSQEAAFLLVMVGNLGALAAGTAAALARETRWPVVATAVGGLAVAVALGEQATLAAGVLGQAATAVLLVVVVRRSGGAAGLGPTVVAWTAGMGLFLLLVFAYYAAYDMVLPAGNGLLPVLAAVLVGLAAAGAMRFGRDQGGRGRLGRDLVPLLAGVALLAAPLLLWATAPGPVEAAPGPARPVRVMSYNLHFGFDVRGWSDLEGVARAIEASGAEVVGLQEVSRGWYVNGSTDMLAWLQRRLRMPNARFAGASDEIWGNAVLSRYPILSGEVTRLPREGVPLRRSVLGVELDLGEGRRLRVVVTHLHHVEGDDGARVRLAQLPRLLEAVAGPEGTVVLGDFNAEPGSAEIARVRAAGLTDAFVAAGGRSADERTWPSDRPDRRIDYIWLSAGLEATGFAATTSTASDHRGIAVTVG